MSERTKDQILADFETLADEKHHPSMFRASERIRQYVVALEECLSRARAEALEEAATMLERIGEARGAIRTRALITTPAPATIPVEKVREAIVAVRAAYALRDTVPPTSEVLGDVALRLGVDLDAKEMNQCVSCGRDVARGRCVGCGDIGSECVCPSVMP